MLRVLSDGDDKHRLEDSEGTSIGWISGRTIGFRGFATEVDARDAAVAAWRALGAALGRQYPGWPRYEPAVDLLHTTHDGAYEWFFDGKTAIARLLRPQRRAYDTSFGIELVLPSYASEGVAITAAHSVAPAVAPHREAAMVAADAMVGNPSSEREAPTST